VTDDTIVIKAPAGTKARWVRQSQRAGMKLSDWVIQNVERPMPDTSPAAAVIPADVLFSDLKLARDADGQVSFDWRPIERICAASGLDIGLFRDGPEDNLAALLASWYQSHRTAGGERDPVYEDLIGEVQAEDAAGQRYSHAPGRA
jgi:hypothetical protein